MPNLTFSDLRTINQSCASLHSTPDWRAVVENIADQSTDFTVDNVRFIDAAYIDDVQAGELSSDLCILGCFNDWFIADILGIDVDVIQAMQKAEAFEAIGKLIMSLGKLNDLQQAYASADGYGHHFNHYDGNEETLTLSSISTTYYVFDNH